MREVLFSDVQARASTDLKACEEQFVVIMNTPSEFEVTGRRCAFHTIPS